MNPVKRYLLNILIIIDEAFNALIFLGDPEETISSRAAKAKNAGKAWGCVLCKFLDLFQKGHCDQSLEPTTGADAVIKDN